jgi:hypothetical protein
MAVRVYGINTSRVSNCRIVYHRECGLGDFTDRTCLLNSLKQTALHIIQSRAAVMPRSGEDWNGEIEWAVFGLFCMALLLVSRITQPSFLKRQNQHSFRAGSLHIFTERFFSDEQLPSPLRIPIRPCN